MLVCNGDDPQPEELTAVNNDPTSIEDTAAVIEKTFGGRWGVWHSDTGRWWASRRHTLSASQLSAGCVPFLRAADPDQLVKYIRTQDDLEAQTTPPHPMAPSAPP
jgi:hypothetical protein